ncbi:MAG: stage II sporulation protein P [Clostridia bacterium]|nr:stage II sporulation protein P [Clostridia bacterium]
MKRWLGILLCMMLMGCVQQEPMQKAADTSARPTISAAAVDITATQKLVTAEPTPVPSPTPLFVPKDDNGNLIINRDLYDSFTKQSFSLPQEPVVLIYHTHAQEAYRQTEDYVYEETEPESYKTLEQDKSIVAIGELLKEALEKKGFTVLHDTTDVEPPEIRSAYSRSLEVMEQYPQATVYIDLHRNTANVRMRKDDVVYLNGQRCAKMFFVVGTSIGTYEGEYDTAHDWKQNYALAKAITEKLQQVAPELATEIRLKVGRYNQHVSPYCMLIELGHNANTFDDAANSVPYLADALKAVLLFDGE